MKIRFTNNPDYVNFLPRTLAAILDQLIWSGPLFWCFSIWAQYSSIETLLAQVLLDFVTILVPMGIVQWIIQLVLMGKFGTSLGKLAFGIQVVDLESKQPIGTWRALLREYIAKPANGLVGGLSYLLVLVDPKHQAIHDHAAGTVVRRQWSLGIITGTILLILVLGVFVWEINSLIPTLQENSLELLSEGREVFLVE